MGRGDKKTKRGKIWRGSFGKTRPKHSNQTIDQKKAAKKTGLTPPPPAA